MPKISFRRQSVRQGIALTATALVLLVILAYQVLAVEGVGYTVGTTTSTTSTAFGQQHKLFYANSLLWAFWWDGSDHVYATSSTNGTTWSAKTAFHSSGTGPSNKMSLYVDSNGYVHYATAEVFSGADIDYRRGFLAANGTITWTPEVTAVDIAPGDYAYYPVIAVDTNGYPFIAYEWWPNGYPNYPNELVVLEDTNNDGTWSTGDNTTVISNASDRSYCYLMPLTSGKMYILYNQDGSPQIYQGRIWNGSSWGSAEDVCDNVAVPVRSGAVSDGDDVHLAVAVYADGDYTGDILYYKRTYGAGWSGNTTIAAEGVGNNPFGNIEVTLRSAHKLTVFWKDCPTANHIYYVEYDGDSWGGVVDWIDESVDTIQGGSGFNALQRANEVAHAGLLYITDAGSPYTVTYAYLNPEEEETEPSGTTPAVTTTATSHEAGYWLLNTLLPVVIAAVILIGVFMLTGNPIVALVSAVIGLAGFFIIQAIISSI